MSKQSIDESIELQENLFEYFKDVDDKTFSEFIDCFVYHTGTQNNKVSKLATAFIEDNGLTNAHINYMHDMENPKQFFSRSNLSECSMMQDIKNSLLSVAYNRFRKVLSQPKSTPMLGRLNKVEKQDLTRVITHCERSNDDLMMDEETTRSMFDKDEAEEIIAERKRFSKLFTKVLKRLK